jgi:DNA-binding transcriptional regulator YdaS (Cro superfamily)
MKTCSTAADCIDALGGTSAFARLYGLDPRRVSEWRKNGLPASRFPEIEPFLRSQGIKADTSAFSFRRPQQSVPWTE